MDILYCMFNIGNVLVWLSCFQLGITYLLQRHPKEYSYIAIYGRKLLVFYFIHVSEFQTNVSEYL